VKNSPINFNDPTGHVCQQADLSGHVMGVCASGGIVPDLGGGIPLGNWYRGDKPKKIEPPTVFSKAIQGDIPSAIDLLTPTHVGGRVQVEVSGDIGVGISGTVGVNLVYNRVSDELAISGDWSIVPGGGIGGGVDATGGLLLGFESSNIDDATTGYSWVASGSAAAGPAATVSISGPFHEDPVYGQVPFTVYVGGGAGAGFADVGGGITGTFAHDKITNLLPWHWSVWK
jgi:hypothetical protein